MSEGYTVGTEHPRSELPNAERRQWHQLSDDEVSDLTDALVRTLAGELGKLGVAGADRTAEWELAGRVQAAVFDHHREARRSVGA